jgi:TonB family protein
VAALHIAAMLALMQKSTDLGARIVRREPMMLQFFEPEAQDAPASADSLPELVQLELTAPMLPELLVESGATLRMLEPPRIDPTARLDLSPFTSRAQLPRGQIATVLILLGIAVDGTVEDAQIVRSTGDESANAAALDYARATRWIPGNVSGEPRAMKASLTVILGEIA